MYIAEMDSLPEKIGEIPVKWKNYNEHKLGTLVHQTPTLLSSKKGFLFPEHRLVEFFWLNKEKNTFLLSCSIPETSSLWWDEDLRKLNTFKERALRWNFYGGAVPNGPFLYRLQDGDWTCELVPHKQPEESLSSVLIPRRLRESGSILGEKYLQRESLLAVKTEITWNKIRKIAWLLGLEKGVKESDIRCCSSHYRDIFSGRFQARGEWYVIANGEYLMKGEIKGLDNYYWNLTDRIYYLCQMQKLY